MAGRSNAAKRKAIQEQFEAGRLVERNGLVEEAIHSYLSLLKTNPLHIDATHRLLILYRKTRQTEREKTLLINSIRAHRKHSEQRQQQWLDAHPKLAEDSRPLAKMLGLLHARELPFVEHEILGRWKLRLERLHSKANKTNMAGTKHPQKNKPGG